MLTGEEQARNVFIDNMQALRNMTLELPRGYFYPKPESRGIRELNRDARITLVQYEATIKQGIESGMLGSTIPHLVMVFLNDAWMLMTRLYAMRNRGEISRKTWRRARRLHRFMWSSVSVGQNPPHNEF